MSTSDQLPPPIGHTTLLDIILLAGVPGAQIDDGRYALPEEEWLLQDVRAYMLDYLEEEVGTWTEDEADCDDFALCAKKELSKIHRKTSVRHKYTGVAFGFTRYLINGSPVNAHAINIYVARLRGVPTVRFLEPQGWRSVTLTPNEIRTCYGTFL